MLGPGGALGRARWIWQFERAAHLPSEAALQRLFLPHPLLIQFFNLYYDALHFPVLIGCMIWLFARHRDSYRRWRTTLVAFTGSCLLVQLIPVAPPRMLPAAGMTDTGVRYHQSVYSAVAGFNADQLSAMPSVHVGWAILVAAAIIGTARSQWRWLAVLYPVLTTLAVVVTANHFWLDGIAAAAILAIVLAAQGLVWRARAALRAPALRQGVVDDDTQGLGEDRSHERELTRADHSAAERLGIDDQAEGGATQVGAVHGDLAEVGADELGTGERALAQRCASEIDVS
ncbi:MAG: phosphatase PAP2 family protein [Streptosporangiaceae bacterium]